MVAGMLLAFVSPMSALADEVDEPELRKRHKQPEPEPVPTSEPKASEPKAAEPKATPASDQPAAKHGADPNADSGKKGCSSEGGRTSRSTMSLAALAIALTAGLGLRRRHWRRDDR